MNTTQLTQIVTVLNPTFTVKEAHTISEDFFGDAIVRDEANFGIVYFDELGHWSGDVFLHNYEVVDSRGFDTPLEALAYVLGALNAQ